ncbi:MFS transporter [Candidatus Thorarchaeota archaeon]|nr:MAG: MFS transporter [Candidatus Thorarchaeota archaeon]
MNESQAEDGSVRQIILLGVLVLLTVSAAALLYTNEPEFILARFPQISKFQYSLFDAVLYLSYLIFGITTGIVSDRIAKRKLFITVGGLGASLFYWFMTVILDYQVLLMMRFVQGAFTVLVWQTLMTLALDNSLSSNRGKNMGIFGMFLATAMGLGPVLGGILAEQSVFQPYYAASLLSLLVGILSIIGIKEPVHLTSQPSLRRSISLAKRNPEITIPATINFVDRLHMGFILTALPLMLVQVLGVSESLRGMVLGLFAMPFILLQYPVGRLSDRIGRFKPVVVGSLAYALILTVIGIAAEQGLVLLVLALMLLGAFSGLTAPPTLAWVGDVTNSKDTATGMGFFNFMGNLGMIVGPLLLGTVLVYSGFVMAFILAGIVELGSLLVVLFGHRRSMQRNRQPASK